MSETNWRLKVGPIAKFFAIIAKIRYDSENLTLRKFRNVCEIFAMSNRKFFLIFEK